MVYSGAWGKLIHEKKQKLKISWHCLFKIHIPQYIAAVLLLLLWIYGIVW